MAERAFSLSELSEATDVEPRTIRGYIERGLLPGPQSRGRGATYLVEHLNRLRAIQAMRRARPNISLSEVSIQLQEWTPMQIQALADGCLTAAAPTVRDVGSDDGLDNDDAEPTEGDSVEQSQAWWDVGRFSSSPELTGAERLGQALRKVCGFTATAPTSSAESWHRIAVTNDIELSIRGEFSPAQLGAFRELADVLRHLLTRPDAIPREVGE